VRVLAWFAISSARNLPNKFGVSGAKPENRGLLRDCRLARTWPEAEFVAIDSTAGVDV